MRGLRDFKVPDFKFPKFKMKDISEIEEMNINYDEIEKNKDKKKDKKEFVATNYNSIKEIFEHSIKTYANKEFILEKFDPKGRYEEISYEQILGTIVLKIPRIGNIILLLEDKVYIILLLNLILIIYINTKRVEEKKKMRREKKKIEDKRK